MLFKVGDKFKTPADRKIFTIESMDHRNVIIMWTTDDGKIQRTDQGSYSIVMVESFFRDGTWKTIRQIRKEKLYKISNESCLYK